MKIEYRIGDLLEAPEFIIVHGCNAQGVMGSGVAKAIRDKYPKAYESYRNTYLVNGGQLRVGETIWVDCGDRIVINAITQRFYGRDPDTVYVSYDGLKEAFEQINENSVVTAGLTSGEPLCIGMPLIGAGLANGDWDIIAAIIERESRNFQPVVYRLPDV